jgi:hypothetical protein
MRIAAALLIAMAVPGANAAAATLTDAKVGFSADRVLIVDGQTWRGKMWNMPGEERHEQNLNGIPSVFILKADNPINDAVLPQLHTVVQFVLPEIRLIGVSGLVKHAVGHDTVEGLSTTRYAIEATVPEGHGAGTLWLSDDGIPLKMTGTFTDKKGKVANVQWALTNVKIGPQPKSLFEPPGNFSKLPAEAIAPLLGLRLKGGSQPGPNLGLDWAVK